MGPEGLPIDLPHRQIPMFQLLPCQGVPLCAKSNLSAPPDTATFLGLTAITASLIYALTIPNG